MNSLGAVVLLVCYPEDAKQPATWACLSLLPFRYEVLNMSFDVLRVARSESPSSRSPEPHANPNDTLDPLERPAAQLLRRFARPSRSRLDSSG